MSIIKSFLLSFISFIGFSALATADYYNQSQDLMIQQLMLNGFSRADCQKVEYQNLPENLYENTNLHGLEKDFKAFWGYNDFASHISGNWQANEEVFMGITNGGGGGANKKIIGLIINKAQDYHKGLAEPTLNDTANIYNFNDIQAGKAYKAVQDYHKGLVEPAEALSDANCFILDESFYNGDIQNINNSFINNESFHKMAITNGGGGGANKQSFSPIVNGIQEAYKVQDYHKWLVEPALNDRVNIIHSFNDIQAYKAVQGYYKEPTEALSEGDCFILDESFYKMGITNGGGGGANKQIIGLIIKSNNQF